MNARYFLLACAICLAASAFLILASATVRAASVTNPSFEADGNVFLDLANASGWSDNVGVFNFNGEINNSDFHTDGAYGVVLLAPTDGSYNAGDNVYVQQSVDLTGVSSVVFDAQLSVHPEGSWLSFLEADFYVDSVKKWSKQDIGTFLDQSIDVTGITGTHSIEFRLQANSPDSATGHANWYEFDNVRLTSIPEPSSMVLFIAGAVGLLAHTWRRRKQAA